MPYRVLCNQCLMPIENTHCSHHGLHFHPGVCWDKYIRELFEQREKEAKDAPSKFGGR